MTRINWIDTAKGITIILVVMGHVVVSYHNVEEYECSTLFNFSHQFVYSFHMALFMMVSGMLQYLSTKRKQLLTKPNRGGVNLFYLIR